MNCFRLTLLLAGLLLSFNHALGQTLISHTKALAGGVSSGDDPGYPITISATGSYKLTSNLLVPANTVGIRITGKGVTLDLNGYTITAGGSCDQSYSLTVSCTQPFHSSVDGVRVEAYDVVVRNGHIRGFSGDGMVLNRNATVEDMRVSDNAGNGIVDTTSEFNTARISNAHVFLNAGHGIFLSTHLMINNSRVERNGGNGIFGNAGSAGLVTHSVIVTNRLSGLAYVGAHETISHMNGIANRVGVTSLGANLDAGVIY